MSNKYAEHSKAAERRKDAYRRLHSRGSRACSRKRRHDTEAEALRWSRRRGHTSMKAYRCPVCNFWHLTKAGNQKGDQ